MTLRPPAAAFQFLDPGPLVDGDLELVQPHRRWVDLLLAAAQHPLTVLEAPEEAAATTRQYLGDYLAAAPLGLHPPEQSRRRVPQYDFWMRLRGPPPLPPLSSAGATHGWPPPRPVPVRMAGGIGLRISTAPHVERYYGHVGYHVYPPARGRHYAERATRLLLPLARRHGLRTLWITCNPDNWASRRTCERLGMELVETVQVPPDEPLHGRGETLKCRYRLAL